MLTGPIYQTDICDPRNGLRYRHQMKCVAGVWLQRHVWYPPTPGVTEPEADDWIKSDQRGPEPDLFTEVEA